MKFFDAGIAASVIARGDKLMTTDGDFDRLGDNITLLKI
jgi:predicted nucleic acid-binding protein